MHRGSNKLHCSRSPSLPFLAVAGRPLTHKLHCWLQEADKQQLLLSPATHYRGYQPLGVNVTLHDAGHTPDWHEAIDFFKEEDPQQVRVRWLEVQRQLLRTSFLGTS